MLKLYHLLLIHLDYMLHIKISQDNQLKNVYPIQATTLKIHKNSKVQVNNQEKLQFVLKEVIRVKVKIQRDVQSLDKSILYKLEVKFDLILNYFIIID